MERLSLPEIKERIEEFIRLRGGSNTTEAAAAEAALFVEEVFGILLSDEEICPEQLGSAEAMEHLVLAKLEAGR